MYNKILTCCLFVLGSLLSGEWIHKQNGGYRYPKKKEASETLTVLISDYGPYSTTQVIQISDSILTHGFATVVYPFDKIEAKDIIWEKNYKDGVKEYPLVVRKLNNNEVQRVSNALKELDTISLTDPFAFTDDYHYVIYIDGNKVFSVFTRSLEMEEFPQEFKILMDDILSIASPLYPNFGLW